jgi:hypothetical protein
MADKTRRNPFDDMTTEDSSWVKSSFRDAGQRARRSDARGRRKDPHISTRTIAARVPIAVVERIEQLAKAEGKTVSKFVADILTEKFGDW